ncbi:hypothetical protein M9458_038661, partial [Cirrhinus mrigala]
KSKKKRDRSPSSSSSSSSSPSPRLYRMKEYHPDEHMEGGGGFNKARLGSREATWTGVMRGAEEDTTEEDMTGVMVTIGD